MLPRFNELKLLAAAIKYKLGGSDNNWNCKSHGHFVPPDFISKKVTQRNFRFITECWACKKKLLFDCAVNDDNELVANCKEYNNSADLFSYFADINNNDYGPMDDMRSDRPPHEDDHKIVIERHKVLSCQVCGEPYSDLGRLKLCQAHTLEALLQVKFTNGISFDRLIEEMKKTHNNEGLAPSLVLQNKMSLITRVMLDTLQGKELADFVLALPNIVHKLEIIKGSRNL
jgi:hypothetical protein